MIQKASMSKTTTVDKRSFQMPYKYFRDEMTRTLERTQPEMADPDHCYSELMWKVPGGESYLLNQKNRRLFRKHGPLKPPHYTADVLENLYFGQDAFVFCPGPSMDMVDLDLFKNKLTIAANSAGFKFQCAYWAIFESNYLIWFAEQKIPPSRRFIMTARCAIRWRYMYNKSSETAVYIPRFEELKIMPHRTPAVGAMGAIVSAWWMGARRIFLVGMDLSRPKKKAYTSGVPYSAFGAKNPFTEQIIAMKQFCLPDVEIYNASPHSVDTLPFKTCTLDEFNSAALHSPDISYPSHGTEKF